MHRTLLHRAGGRVVLLSSQHQHLLVLVLAVDRVQRDIQGVFGLGRDDLGARTAAEEQALFVAGDLNFNGERDLAGLGRLATHLYGRILVPAGDRIGRRGNPGDPAVELLLPSGGGGELHAVALRNVGNVRLAHIGADHQAGIIRDRHEFALRNVAFSHVHARDQAREWRVHRGFTHLVLKGAVAVAELGRLRLTPRRFQLCLQLVALLRSLCLRRSEVGFRFLQRRVGFVGAHGHARPGSRSSTPVLSRELGELVRGYTAGVTLTHALVRHRWSSLRTQPLGRRRHTGCRCRRLHRRSGPHTRQVRGNAAGGTLDGVHAAVNQAGSAVGCDSSVIGRLRLVQLCLSSSDRGVGAVIQPRLVGVELGLQLVHRRLRVSLRVRLLLLLDLQLALKLLGVEGGQKLLRLDAVARLHCHLFHLRLHRGGDIDGANRLDSPIDHNTV